MQSANVAPFPSVAGSTPTECLWSIITDTVKLLLCSAAPQAASQALQPHLCCRQHYIRVPTGDITDPVKRDIEKTLRERRLLGIRQPPRRPVSAEGKETLSTLLWNKLDSTPCGHHMDTTGAYVLKPMTAADAELRKSHVVFDHYNVARGAKGEGVW